MRFEKIRWKNTLSTGNVFTEIDVTKSPTSIIIGKNGAGKSTLLDVLDFNLYGKPYRKDFKKGQLVNSINKKNMLTETEFSVNGSNFLVRRGQKPNVFEIYRDGGLINQDASTLDYQEYLEKHILKVNLKTFNQIIVLGSAKYVQFMELPAGNRREIIEDVLDLQIFTKMNQNLKDRIQSNEKIISDFENEKKLIEQKVSLILRHQQEIEDMHDRFRQEKLDRIEETEEKINELKKSSDDYKKEIDSLNELISDFDALNRRESKILELTRSMKTKIDHLNSDIRFFDKNDSCPTCKQLIGEEFKNMTLSEKNDRVSELNSALSKLNDDLLIITTRLQDIGLVKKDIRSLESKVSENRVRISSFSDYITETRGELKKKVVKRDVEDIGELKSKLASLESDYNDAMATRSIYQAAGFLLKDSGTKARIIKKYVPIINDLINSYLASMEFFIDFNLDENFNETIRSRYRDEFTYSSFSEGEKFRINLAILFTWRQIAKKRNSVSTNLLIMDETLDGSLDDDGIEYFFKILNKFSNDNVFVISHGGERVIERFDRVIQLKKIKNFSKIVSERVN